MKEIKIVGAGLSGLIMAEVLSANGFEYRIFESELAININLENNVYYYHTNNIQKILPIPLKRILINKCYYDQYECYKYTNPIHLFEYTSNHNNIITNSSVEDCGKEIVGYVEDFGLNLHKILIERHRGNIVFGAKVGFDSIAKNNDYILINTAPLSLLNTLFTEKIELKKEINNIAVYTLEGINLDNIIIIHATDGFKRIVLNKNKMIIEGMTDEIDNIIRKMFPLNSVQIKGQCNTHYYSINKIDEVIRKNILFELTKNYNIYNLGRYATWSYKRVDHVVEDALDIVKMIRYSQHGRW